jgi:hypothetical protein
MVVKVEGVEAVQVNADAQLDDDNVMVTLTGSSWLVNVHASPSEWTGLSNVRTADWNQRQSVRLGNTNGSPVWWSVTADQLTLCIGRDDESSNVVLVLSIETLAAVEHALANLDTGNWRDA